jgi:hypothetical protein
MGGFALCIENATRDIHSLLTLHRVHPQVHADIQRILGSLLRKQYTDMTVLHSPELADAPEQVCRALVENIVDQTIHTAIPAASFTSLEGRCMRLEEEKDLLEAETSKAEAQLAETQTVLRSLKDAHDYMLHSYFREVLTLRSRIDDLQRQNRAYRTQASANAATAVTTIMPGTSVGASAIFSTSMGSQLQQFGLNNSAISNNSPSKDNTTGKRLGTDDASSSEAAAGASDTSAQSTSSTSANREAKADKVDNASLSSSPTKDLAETRRGVAGGESFVDVRAQATLTPAAGSRPSTAKGVSLSPRGKDRSVRIASPLPSASPQRQTMTIQTTTTCEVVPLPEPESVDAIFDYEEYIRILNGQRGSWSKRFVAVMNEPGGGARRRRRSLRVRTRTFSDVVVCNESVNIPSSETETPSSGRAADPQQQQAKTKGFQWLLHLALEPIQHKFHEQLHQLRQAVHTMQKEHARDVQAISRALVQVQSRNDALLDFLETFVQGTKRTIAVLARDSHAHTITDLLSSGALPVEKSDNITTFFTPSVSPSLGSGPPTPSPTPPPPLTQLAEMVGGDAGEESMAHSTFTHSLHPRKEWRLKPDARLTFEKRTAAMKAMDRRLKRPDMSKAAAATTAPPEANTAENYYRADLGLPYWSAHPITLHAQEVFGELQLVAKEMRMTRVQQLYAVEEAVAFRAEDGAGGRRVHFDKPVQTGGATRTGRRRRNDFTSSPVKQNPDSFYSVEVEGVAAQPHKRLQEGWRTKTVAEGAGATAADLLQELVHLRMRRACDQIRLTRVQDTILRAFYPDLVGQEETQTTWKKRGKQVAPAGVASARLKLTEMPPINCTSPEDVLKHRTLQRLRTDTQKRVSQTSQRIAELQRLLAIHYAENEVQEVTDCTSIAAARRLAKEEAAGVYRVNGETKTTQQLWSSPYLNDGNGSTGSGGVLYLPVGLASTVDADGNVGGGAGAVVMLGDTPISVAPFAASTAGLSDRQRRRWHSADGEQGVGAADGDSRHEDTHGVREGGDEHGGGKGGMPDETSEPRNTPFVAVMDYCRGVQLGRPIGRRGGPVYLFQDANSGAYYVGDAEGRPAIAGSLVEKGKDEGDAAQVGSPATGNVSSPVEAAEGRRPPLAMTRILFPAPLHHVSSTRSPADKDGNTTASLEETTTASAMTKELPAASSVPTKYTTTANAASLVTTKALQPLYLVPMAIPLSDEEAAIREGWQACHRHGHTRQDPIFYSTLSPLPLSSSYHHVVPQRQHDSASSGVQDGSHYSSPNGNKYFVDPPLVFQPVDEASSMMRVSAVRLQSRRTSESTPHATTEPEAGDNGMTFLSNAEWRSAPTSQFPVKAGLSSVLSDSTNPGLTVSPAETTLTAPTTTVTPPSLVQPSSHPLNLVQPTSTNEAAATTPAAAASSRLLAASTGGVSTFPHNENAAFAATTPLPLSSPPPAAASSGAKSMMAAVLFAKQQRAARLAKEAETASQLKTQRQEAWQQRSDAQAPALTQKEVFLRLPHLAPLPSHSTETSSLLPSAVKSARLQRQMRPEKYSLNLPPPSSSRRSESSKLSSSEWNLKDDA